MAKFKRSGDGPASESYSVGLNIVLSGSKKMAEGEIEALLSTDGIHVLIVDVNDEGRVLVDEAISAKQFTTGSVGFGFNTRGLKFRAVE